MSTRIVVASLMLLLTPSLCRAQAVQLPTFTFFGASTTVLVPDSGTAFVAGVKSDSMGRTDRGIPGIGGVPVLGRPVRNSGIGRSTTAGGISITAQIHDFEAMDKALLEKGAAQLAAEGNPRFKEIAAGIDRNAPPSVAEIQQRQQRVAAERQTEAAVAFQNGLDALRDGKTTFAKIYFTSAARDSSGDLHDQAVAQLQRIAATSRSRIATAEANSR